MFGAAEQLMVPQELEKTPFPGDGHGGAPGLWHRSVAELGGSPGVPVPCHGDSWLALHISQAPCSHSDMEKPPMPFSSPWVTFQGGCIIAP